MTTLTHGSGTAPQYGRETRRWSMQHPYVATIGLMLAAILCGLLVGLLFNTVMNGAEPAAVHRGGGAARIAAVHRAQASAAKATIGMGGFAFSWERSPARSGFAVGRAAGAGSGAWSGVKDTTTP